MTSYPKSAYKNPFPNGVPSSSSLWGPGWPNCQASKMKTVVAQDQTAGHNSDIRVTVRGEIAPMVADLLEATDKLYNVDPNNTGGYNCRPIAGTSKPSNHSRGLAIDINWNKNPQSSTFHSEIPPAVVAMWLDCGWGWGGFYKTAKYDTMHFEYLGKPSDVKADSDKAAKYNEKGSTPPVTTKLTQKQVLQLALDAGFSRADANVMSVIAFYESGWDPKNIGDATLSKYGSRGLWQIFTKVHDPVETGVSTTEHVWTDALIKKLEDPAANAHAAHVVFKSQGFKAWSTWNNRAQHSGWAGLLAKAEAIDFGTPTPTPNPTPTPKPAPKPLKLAPGVQPGKRDPQVKDLQRFLVLAGYGPIPGYPTTHYGKATEDAVNRFHKKNPAFSSNAQYDGAIGPKGFAELQKQAAKK